MCREPEDAATTSSPRGAHGEVRHHSVSVQKEDHDSVMKIVLAVYTAVHRATRVVQHAQTDPSSVGPHSLSSEEQKRGRWSRRPLFGGAVQVF